MIDRPHDGRLASLSRGSGDGRKPDVSGRLALIRRWCRKHGVALCWLFGSRCTPYADALSDWDIGVVFTEHRHVRGSTERWLDVIGDLETIFDGEKVDLVFLDEAPMALRNAAIQGELLYAISERARADYVERVWRLWWDLRPFVEAFEREQDEAILSGHFLG